MARGTEARGYDGPEPLKPQCFLPLFRVVSRISISGAEIGCFHNQTAVKSA